MAHALQAPLPAPLAQWTRLVMALGECTTEFRTRLNKGQAIGFITAENMEKSQHTDFNEDTTNESASVACSNIWL